MKRIVLLVTSPRLPAGLLSARAWELLRSAGTEVYAGTESPQTAAVTASGIAVRIVADGVSTLLDAPGGTVVWLAGPEGDQELARGLGRRLLATPGTAELEVVHGSWDPPGARLLDVVAVMDRLRSPGGCPWDAAQTHSSLGHYLLEETYEAYDAIVTGDRAALREELGDVLLQVVFHARVAEEATGDDPEAGDGPWSIDDVAGDLVTKLVRRHPHVFSDVAVADAEEVHATWDQIKRAEKSRTSAVEGVALSQPALALAAKLLSRAGRAGVAVPVAPPPAGFEALLDGPSAADVDEDGESVTGTPPGERPGGPSAAAPDRERVLGEALFAVVAAAQAQGLDPEAALRRAALDYADAVRAQESRTP